MHRDHKGRHSPAVSRIAKVMRGNTSPKERGGPARRPGNPGLTDNGGKEKKIGKMEAIRERQPKMGEKEWEDVEKSGGYRKASARYLKRMYHHHPSWARKG